jgi:hypothetical protein
MRLQWLIDPVLSGLPFAFIYLDVVLISHPGGFLFRLVPTTGPDSLSPVDLRCHSQPGPPWHQSRFVWPCLASQVAAWCRDWQKCQRAKVTSQLVAVSQHIVNPTQWFSHLHIDQVGPLPASSSSHTHLFTILDCSSRWQRQILYASPQRTAALLL